MNSKIKISEKTGTCIVISAGDFTPIDIGIKEGDLCIAVDGGYSYCKLMGITPDLIVGDMDSVDERSMADIVAVKEAEPGKVIIFNQEKDDTDTLAALKIGIEEGYQSFRIYGAMGGRTDHTIANIQCLSFLKNKGITAYIMDANVMMTVIKNETVKFNRFMEGYMSLFSLNEKAEGVTITGMKFPLDKATVTNDYPVGTSNEFTQEEGCVSVENGMLLIIVTWA